MRRSTALALLLATASCSCEREREARPAPSQAQSDTASGDEPAPGETLAETASGDEPAQPDAASLVQVELLAGVEHIAPGAAFELGARFTMAPGWHIYWKNPGESGMETRARFEASAPIELGEVAYPGPIRFESPGHIVSYGYKDEAVLLVRGKAPERMAPGGDVRFRVHTSWVACRDVCIVGRVGAELTLPVRAGAPEPANRGVLARHRALVPRPWSELAGASLAWTEKSQDERVLGVRVPGARAVDFFPAAEQPAVFAGHESRVDSGSGVIEIQYRGTPRPSIPAGGVVRVETSTGTRYYRLEVPWS